MAGVSLFLRSLTLLHGASNSHTRTDSNAFWTSILIWSRVLASLLPSRSKSAEKTAAASVPTACQSRNTMWRWPNFGATAGGEEEDEDEEDVSCATFLAARAFRLGLGLGLGLGLVRVRVRVTYHYAQRA